MNIYTISNQGSKHNEDLWDVHDDYILLLDGSSGLSEKQTQHSLSDAVWYVEAVKEALRDCFKVELSTPALLQQVIEQVRGAYEKEVSHDVQKHAQPSASLILMREQKEQYEITSLGDATCILELMDGTFRLIQDDRVSLLDQIVIDKMLELQKDNQQSFISQRAYVNDLLQNNRLKKNVKDGYSIMGLDDICHCEPVIVTVEKDNIKSMLFASDGFIDYVNYTKCTYEELFHLIQTNGLDEIVRRLRDIQANDSDCETYPRLKSQDDATAIYLSKKAKI